MQLQKQFRIRFSLTSLSQAEISGGEMEPFTIEMEALNERKKKREEADTRGYFSKKVIISKYY